MILAAADIHRTLFIPGRRNDD